jgi:5-formyltetrahydrofolate cyclo-ligase
MQLLQIYNSEDLHSLPSGTWGIKEPCVEWRDAKRMNGEYSVCIFAVVYAVDLMSLEVLDEECEGLDLILVPGAYSWIFNI